MVFVHANILYIFCKSFTLEIMLFKTKNNVKYSNKLKIVLKLHFFNNLNKFWLASGDRMKNGATVYSLWSKFMGVATANDLPFAKNGEQTFVYENNSKIKSTFIDKSLLNLSWKHKLAFYKFNRFWNIHKIFYYAKSDILDNNPVSYKMFDFKALYVKYNLNALFMNNNFTFAVLFLFIRDVIFFIVFVIFFFLFVLIVTLIFTVEFNLFDFYSKIIVLHTFNEFFFHYLINLTLYSGLDATFLYTFNVQPLIDHQIFSDQNYYNFLNANTSLINSYVSLLSLELLELYEFFLRYTSNSFVLFFNFEYFLTKFLSILVGGGYPENYYLKKMISWFYFNYSFFSVEHSDYYLYRVLDFASLYSGLSTLSGGSDLSKYYYSTYFWPTEYYWVVYPLKFLWFLSSYFLYDFLLYSYFYLIFDVQHIWIIGSFLLVAYIFFIVTLYCCVYTFTKKLLVTSDSWDYIMRWLYLSDEDLKLVSTEPILQLLGASADSSKSINNKLQMLTAASSDFKTNYYNTSELYGTVASEEVFTGYAGFLNSFPSEQAVFHPTHFVLNRNLGGFSFKNFLKSFKRKHKIISNNNIGINQLFISRIVNISKLNYNFRFFFANIFTRVKFYAYRKGSLWGILLNFFKSSSSKTDNRVTLVRKKIQDYGYAPMEYEYDHSENPLEHLVGNFESRHLNANESGGGGSITDKKKMSGNIFDLNYISYLPEWDQELINDYINSQNLNSYFSKSRFRLFKISGGDSFNEFSFLKPEFNYDDHLEYSSPEKGPLFVLFDEEGNFLSEEDEDDDKAYDFGDELYYEDGYLSNLTDFYDDEIEEEESFEGLYSDDEELNSTSNLELLDNDEKPGLSDDEYDESDFEFSPDLTEHGWGQEFDNNQEYRGLNYNSKDVRLSQGDQFIYTEAIFSNIYEDVSNIYYLNSFLSNYENFFLFPAKRALFVPRKKVEAVDFGWFQRGSPLGRLFSLYLKNVFFYFFSSYRFDRIKFVSFLFLICFFFIYLFWYTTVFLVSSIFVTLMSYQFFTAVSYLFFIYFIYLIVFIFFISFFWSTWLLNILSAFFTNLNFFFLIIFSILSLFTYISCIFFNNLPVNSSERCNNYKNVQPTKLVKQLSLSNVAFGISVRNNLLFNLLNNFTYRNYFKYFSFNSSVFNLYPVTFNPSAVLLEYYLRSFDVNFLFYPVGLSQYTLPYFVVQNNRFFIFEIKKWWTFYKRNTNTFAQSFVKSSQSSKFNIKFFWFMHKNYYFSSYKKIGLVTQHDFLLSQANPCFGSFKLKAFDFSPNSYYLEFNCGEGGLNSNSSAVKNSYFINSVFKEFKFNLLKSPSFSSVNNFFFTKVSDISWVNNRSNNLKNVDSLSNGGMAKFLYSNLTIPRVNSITNSSSLFHESNLFNYLLPKHKDVYRRLSYGWDRKFKLKVVKHNVFFDNFDGMVYNNTDLSALSRNNNSVNSFDLSLKDADNFFISNNYNYNYGFDLLRFKKYSTSYSAPNSVEGRLVDTYDSSYDKEFFYVNFFGHDLFTNKSFEYLSISKDNALRGRAGMLFASKFLRKKIKLFLKNF